MTSNFDINEYERSQCLGNIQYALKEQNKGNDPNVTPEKVFRSLLEKCKSKNELFSKINKILERVRQSKPAASGDATLWWQNQRPNLEKMLASLKRRLPATQSLHDELHGILYDANDEAMRQTSSFQQRVVCFRKNLDLFQKELSSESVGTGTIDKTNQQVSAPTVGAASTHQIESSVEGHIKATEIAAGASQDLESVRGKIATMSANLRKKEIIHSEVYDMLSYVTSQFQAILDDNSASTVHVEKSLLKTVLSIASHAKDDFCGDSNGSSSDHIVVDSVGKSLSARKMSSVASALSIVVASFNAICPPPMGANIKQEVTDLEDSHVHKKARV